MHVSPNGTGCGVARVYPREPTFEPLRDHSTVWGAGVSGVYLGRYTEGKKMKIYLASDVVFDAHQQDG